MSLVIELPFNIEQSVVAEAEKEGVSPEEVIVRVMRERFTQDVETERQRQQNEDSIVLLQSWLSEAPTTPEEKQEAEDSVTAFKENLDAPRKIAGARLLFPSKS
jgi:hypothetical protein